MDETTTQDKKSGHSVDTVPALKVLFLYRSQLFKDQREQILNGGPVEFLWGFPFVQGSSIEVKAVNTLTRPKRFWFVFFFPLERLFSRLTRLGFPLDVFFRARREIQWATDVICVNDGIGLALSFWKALGFAKRLRVHCIPMSLSERLKYFRSVKPVVRWISYLLSRTETVICLSQIALMPLVETFGVPVSKARSIQFGVDTDFWSPGESKATACSPYALSIGNDMNRDYKTLVQAVPANVPLRIITRKRIATSRDSVEVISTWLPSEEIREMYRGASLVIIPVEKVEFESSGLSTCLQALACGSPVITADSPALRENLKGLSGVTFYEAGNVADLRAKILAAWNSRPSRVGTSLVPTSARVGEQLEKIVTNAGGVVPDSRDNGASS